MIVTVETLNVYDEIQRNLESAGGCEYKSYIFWKEMDLKLAIVYGNCHFSVLAEYLNNNQIFNHEYLIRRYSVTGLEKNYPSDEELKRCDLLIVQDIRKTNYLNAKSADELIAKTSEKAIVLRVPNLYGYNLYFPQAKVCASEERTNLHRDVVFNDNKIIMNQVALMTGWQDENIECWGNASYNADTIVDMIETKEVYSAEDILRNFEKEISKIKDREEDCDIKISDYILDMYQKIKLFYDPRHPAKELIHEKGRRILKALGMEMDEEIPSNLASDDMEIPVYGCVKSALGLKFKERLLRKYQTNCSIYQRPVSVKEYVEEYLWWNQII